MNDLPSDPTFSYETSEDLFLFTSLTAGSSHIITATSRMETILKANRIPFKAVDCATDEKARRIWGRRAAGRKLPGLVKEGQVLADLDAVEEWNEYGEIKQVLGSEAATKEPAVTIPVGMTKTSKENEKPASSATLDSSKGTATQSTASASTGTKLSGAAKESTPAISQLHAQLGNEAAAMAALHAKDAPKSILEKNSKRQNSADLLSKAEGSEITAPITDKETPTASDEAKPQHDTPAHHPSISFAQEPSRDNVPAPDARFTSFAPSKSTDASVPDPLVTADTSSEPLASSTEPIPTMTDPARAPRASVTAGDLAVSTSPPTSQGKGMSMSSDDNDGPAVQQLSAASSPPASAPAPAPAPASAGNTAAPSGTTIEQRHRGSSFSVATEEEVRDAEARNVILEEDEGPNAQACV